jgi:hypothetical protein
VAERLVASQVGFSYMESVNYVNVVLIILAINGVRL